MNFPRVNIQRLGERDTSFTKHLSLWSFYLLIPLSDSDEKPVVKKSLLYYPCPPAFVFSKFSDLVWGQRTYSCSIRLSPDTGKEPVLAGRGRGLSWWGGQQQISQNETKNICLCRVGRHVHPERNWHPHGNCKWTLQFSRLINSLLEILFLVINCDLTSCPDFFVKT